jgi:hypothetical protein
VPRRRLLAPSLAAAAALIFGGVAIGSMSGCAIELTPGSVPVPFSIAPTPSASAGRPAYVCSAVYKVLTDGAVRLASYVGGSSDAAKTGMRATLTSMATQVTDAGARSVDPAQRAAISAIADSLTQGAQLDDPKTYINGDFVTVSRKIDNTCGS